MMVDLFSTQPSKVFGCIHQKEIKIGSDADLVNLESASRIRYHQDASSNCDINIYEGLKRWVPQSMWLPEEILLSRMGL